MTKRGWYASLTREQKNELNAKKRARYHNDPAAKRAMQSSWTKARYGITLDDKEAMLASQGGVCACCGDIDTTKHGWHIDHDHETGVVREILCHPCNVMLGNAGDSLDRLIEGVHYLMKHGKKFNT